MKQILEALNKKEIFHTVTTAGVEIMKQPAELDSFGKNMLKKYFGLDDFTVPKALKDPFNNKMSEMTKQMTDKAKGDAAKMADKVHKGY